MTVGVYRAAEDMWAARPEFEAYPPGWWRMVVARAAHEVPGVEIVYAWTHENAPPDRSRAGRFVCGSDYSGSQMMVMSLVCMAPPLSPSRRSR